MKRFTVDRFEGDFAVLLDDEKRVISVKKAVLSVQEQNRLKTYPAIEYNSLYGYRLWFCTAKHTRVFAGAGKAEKVFPCGA